MAWRNGRRRGMAKSSQSAKQRNQRLQSAESQYPAWQWPAENNERRKANGEIISHQYNNQWRKMKYQYRWQYNI